MELVDFVSYVLVVSFKFFALSEFLEDIVENFFLYEFVLVEVIYGLIVCVFCGHVFSHFDPRLFDTIDLT